MNTARCPRCGAPANREQPDPLARCAFCGALLASHGFGETPMVAHPRFDERQIRDRVRRSLDRSLQQTWRPASLQLVYYPFTTDGPARQPYRPLAPLPPLIAAIWRPSGADLVREAPDGEDYVGATCVPAAEKPAAGQGVVMYPFFRVQLAGVNEESACWFDGIDGQTMLPEELRVQASRSRGKTLGKTTAIAFGIGLGGGLLLPFPFSLLGVAAAGAVLWTREDTR